MPGKNRRTITTLNGPSDDGLLPPDPDVILEQRKLEMKEAAVKAAADPPPLTVEEEDEVVDLCNVGRKQSWPVIFGRKIHLRTLTIDEELKVSEITRPYIGSDGYPRAYRTAVTAAAIRSIDGKLLFNPISAEDFENIIEKKFEVLLSYYPLGVDQIYGRYREMELELLALVEKLGKSSG